MHDNYIYAQNSQLSQKQQSKINLFLAEATKHQKNNSYRKEAQVLSNIAFIYWKSRNYSKAIEYFKRSINSNGKAKNYKDIRIIYSNIGLIYAELEAYNNSLNYFNKSLKVSRLYGNKQQISAGLTDVAYILSIKRDYNKSIKKLLEALELAFEIKHSKLILKCYQMLAENYKALGITQKYQEYSNKSNDYQIYVEKTSIKEEYKEKEIKNKAQVERINLEKRAKELELELMNLEKEAADEIYKQTLKQKAVELAVQNAENEKKRREVELLKKEQLLNEKTIALQLQEQEKQKYIIYGGVALILLFSIIGILLIINNIRKRKANKILEERNMVISAQKAIVTSKSDELEKAFKKIKIQNKNITDSINYARKIQEAILVPFVQIEKVLPDSFIFYRPRDVVSGDYYWFNHVEIENNGIKQDKIFISAVDCTGHGVPGALLSMIGYNILDDIVTNREIYEPNIILEKLHIGIRNALKQEKTENRDGMDMALCVYTPQENILEFSGAKNPLFYCNEFEMKKIKGNSVPIGGFLVEKGPRVFKKHTIEINSPTMFYIFSDGYPDQFGGNKSRKFMASRFRDLLESISKKDMNEQKAMLDTVLDGWKGDNEQTDDIIVIGFKLTKI